MLHSGIAAPQHGTNYSCPEAPFRRFCAVQQLGPQLSPRHGCLDACADEGRPVAGAPPARHRRRQIGERDPPAGGEHSRCRRTIHEHEPSHHPPARPRGARDVFRRSSRGWPSTSRSRQSHRRRLEPRRTHAPAPGPGRGSSRPAASASTPDCSTPARTCAPSATWRSATTTSTSRPARRAASSSPTRPTCSPRRPPTSASR